MIGNWKIQLILCVKTKQIQPSHISRSPSSRLLRSLQGTHFLVILAPVDRSDSVSPPCFYTFWSASAWICFERERMKERCSIHLILVQFLNSWNLTWWQSLRITIVTLQKKPIFTLMVIMEASDLNWNSVTPVKGSFLCIYMWYDVVLSLSVTKLWFNLYDFHSEMIQPSEDVNTHK